MRPTLVFYAAWLATILPVAAGAAMRRAETPSRRAVLVWATLLFAGNALALGLSASGSNTHWIVYVSTPLTGVAALRALIGWQVHGLARRVLLAAVPLYVVGWGVLVLLVERTTTFSLVAGPSSSLLLLAASAATLVLRAPNAVDPLARQDWFWITIGFIIFYGVETGLPPLALLLGDRPDLVRAAYEWRSITFIAAMLVVTKGLLCPILSPLPGGSSSSLASPSSSSPLPSG